MTTEVPPSYQEAINNLGSNPSLQDVQTTVEKLASLGPAPSQPSLSSLGGFDKTQKLQFSTAVVKCLRSDEGYAAIKQVTQDATDSIAKINSMFLALNGKLASIDKQYTSPKDGTFAPKLVAIQELWFNTISDSKTLAEQTSVYAKRFVTAIIPLIDDPNQTIQFKKEKIQEYIDKSEKFKVSADQIKASYNDVLQRFGSLNGSFNSWAFDKEKDLKGQIAKAQEELGNLQVLLAKKQQELLFVGASAAVALPITGVAAWLAGPFAPAVIIIGAIVTASLVSATIALTVAVNQLHDKIDSKKQQITNLNTQIKAIDDARKQLCELGNTDLVILTTSIGGLISFWENAKADAIKIGDNLSDMKDDINWPDVFNLEKQTVIDAYTCMITYLDLYARGANVSLSK